MGQFNNQLHLLHPALAISREIRDRQGEGNGLGNLGKKEDYVARQIRTWYRSWEASIEGASYDDPVLHQLRRQLHEIG